MEESTNSSNGCEHATALMKSVPTMTQRIAGKSLPIEKFAARKVKVIFGGRLTFGGEKNEFSELCYGINQ